MITYMYIYCRDKLQDRAKETPLPFPDEPPAFLPELLRYSSMIGQRLIQARLDFFVFDGKFTFSEVTFSHCDCHFSHTPKVIDQFLGYLIQHPEVKVESDYMLKLTGQIQP